MNSTIIDETVDVWLTGRMLNDWMTRQQFFSIIIYSIIVRTCDISDNEHKSQEFKPQTVLRN